MFETTKQFLKKKPPLEISLLGVHVNIGDGANPLLNLRPQLKSWMEPTSPPDPCYLPSGNQT